MASRRVQERKRVRVGGRKGKRSSEGKTGRLATQWHRCSGRNLDLARGASRRLTRGQLHYRQPRLLIDPMQPSWATAGRAYLVRSLQVRTVSMPRCRHPRLYISTLCLLPVGRPIFEPPSANYRDPRSKTRSFPGQGFFYKQCNGQNRRRRRIVEFIDLWYLWIRHQVCESFVEKWISSENHVVRGRLIN